MVHFEPGKIVVEIPTGDTFYEYLMILNTLTTIGWFAAKNDEDNFMRDAYRILGFYIGQALINAKYLYTQSNEDWKNRKTYFGN